MKKLEITIDGVTYTKASMNEVFNEERQAKIFCILNIWQTPKCLGIGRKLTRDEVKLFMKILTVRKSIWLKVWNGNSERWGATE